MFKPFFSIIIPTLNEEKYLPKLLEALSRQTYKNFETIVVDADSVDQTVIVGKKYSLQLPRLRFIVSPERNPAYQRNLGARDAKGEFFVFLDADVIIPPNYLGGIHKEIVLRDLRFVTTLIEGDSRSIIDRIIIFVANLLAEPAKAIGKPFASGDHTIVQWEVFDKVGGFRDDLAISDDYDFSLRVTRAGYKLAILKQPRSVLSLRRLRVEGIWRMLHRFVKTHTYFFLKGPITKPLFDYKMGGHVHSKNRE